MKRFPHRRFTLIEMLVVIAIISVLASMLMPSLMKAIESGKKITCMNNLKNIGIASHMYADDYNNYMPTSYYNSQDTRMLVAPYLQAVDPTQVKEFSCPSWPDIYGVQGVRSYSRAHIIASDGVTKLISSGDLLSRSSPYYRQKPSRMCFMFDAVKSAFNDQYCNTADWFHATASYRHSGSLNYLAYAGNVVGTYNAEYDMFTYD